MSLSRNEIYNLVIDLQKRLAGAQLVSIKEVSSYKWVYVFKKQEEYLSLLVCLKAPFTRIHLLSEFHKAVETPQTKLWEAVIGASILEKIEMAGMDRIVKLSLRKGRILYCLVFEVFPQHPNIYLLDAQDEIMYSCHPIEKSHYELPVNLKAQEALTRDASVTQAAIEQKYEKEEQAAAFRQLSASLHAKLQQKFKKNAKLQSQAIENLERSQKWSQIQHEGVLLQAHWSKLKKGMTECVVADWEQDGKEVTLGLDPRLSPQEIIADRFKLSKKLKNGQAYHRIAIEKLQGEVQQLEILQAALAKADTLAALKALENSLLGTVKTAPKAPKKRLPPLPYHEFTSFSGVPIWVGKNAVGNDKLTFSYAKGSDWWLHVHDYPGSHVVIRTPKRQEPDEETIEDALQLAMAYSKAKDKGEAEVCITQCKFVSRTGKNQPGKVQISKHKLVYVKFDPQRFQKIKERGK